MDVNDAAYAIIIGLLIPINPVINPYIYSINEIRLLIRFLKRKLNNDR